MELFVSGSAIVRASATRPVVQAVLDATNRRISRTGAAARHTEPRSRCDSRICLRDQTSCRSGLVPPRWCRWCRGRSPQVGGAARAGFTCVASPGSSTTASDPRDVWMPYLADDPVDGSAPSQTCWLPRWRAPTSSWSRTSARCRSIPARRHSRQACSIVMSARSCSITTTCPGSAPVCTHPMESRRCVRASLHVTINDHSRGARAPWHRRGHDPQRVRPRPTTRRPPWPPAAFGSSTDDVVLLQPTRSLARTSRGPSSSPRRSPR